MGTGTRHKIVRKTDSDFGVDAQAGPGVPRVLINLAHQVSPHDLVMGGISPESPSGISQSRTERARGGTGKRREM